MAFTARVSISLNRAAINRELQGDGGSVDRYLKRTAERVEDLAKDFCPVATGRLRASIRAGRVFDGPRVSRIAVSFYAQAARPSQRGRPTSNYGIWVHEGTGVYAGRGLITPRRKRYMRFPLPKSGKRGIDSFVTTGGIVYARAILGQPAQPFATRALEAVAGSDPRVRLVQTRRR